MISSKTGNKKAKVKKCTPLLFYYLYDRYIRSERGIKGT
nr:MAG TPA: hypothetical protein [Caudoviricetes sp.]